VIWKLFLSVLVSVNHQYGAICGLWRSFDEFVLCFV